MAAQKARIMEAVEARILTWSSGNTQTNIIKCRCDVRKSDQLGKRRKEAEM